MAEERILNSSKNHQVEFVKRLWPNFSSYDFQEEHYVRFFQYVDYQMEALKRQHTSYYTGSWDHICHLIEQLRGLGNKKAAIISQQTSVTSSPNFKSRSTEVAASIWLTVRVESPLAGRLNIQGNCIEWAEHETLNGCMDKYFTKTKDDIPYDKRNHIPRGLTIAHICRRYGFSVVWTNNLVDHLRINWMHKEIAIYEHLICLWNHLNYTNNCPIPKAILEEAIDTLNLLFPSENKETQAFLKITGRSFWKLGYCERERLGDLSGYKFWRRNVLHLVEILDEPPSGYHQIGLDKERQNFLNWATFWIATLVAVLTVASIVFGVVSTVYGVKSYNIGVAQLEFAIAQACAAPDAASSLPQYCSENR